MAIENNLPATTLPESGNIIGTLSSALSLILSLTDGSDSEKQAVMDRFNSIETYDDAGKFLEELNQLEEARCQKKVKDNDTAFKKRQLAIKKKPMTAE